MECLKLKTNPWQCARNYEKTPKGQEIVDFIKSHFQKSGIDFSEITQRDPIGMELFQRYEDIRKKATSPFQEITVADLTELYKLKDVYLEGRK